MEFLPRIETRGLVITSTTKPALQLLVELFLFLRYPCVWSVRVWLRELRWGNTLVFMRELQHYLGFYCSTIAVLDSDYWLREGPAGAFARHLQTRVRRV